MERTLNREAVKAAMTASGRTAADVASELSVSKTAVSKWLKGQSFPRPRKLLDLARLLGLTLDQLTLEIATEETPVVAFRKKGAAKTTENHVKRARDMGYSLRPLVDFLPFDKLERPPTLKAPSTDYSYLQEVALRLRKEIGVADTSVVDIPHLIKRFVELQAVVVPVMWGSKKNHENALHILLPDTLTTWVYLNLDVEIHDFKFWMAHELAHCMAPELRGEAGEEFADALAGAILFPHPVAEKSYESVRAARKPANQMNRLKALAEQFLISPYSVYLEINNYAQQNDLPPISLGSAIHGASKNLSRNYYNVAQTLFDGDKPDAAKYVSVTASVFETHFFSALKNFLVQSGTGPGYVQTVLNIPIMDARAIHQELA